MLHLAQSVLMPCSLRSELGSGSWDEVAGRGWRVEVGGIRMRNRVLAVDVGNSRTKFAVFARDASSLLVAEWHAVIANETDEPWTEICAKVGLSAVCGVAGSNPARRQELLERWPAGLSQPYIIDHYSQLPVELDVESPERVGLDRILNAVACRRRGEENSPAVIVDSGTATTVDILDEAGVFRGGAILPGIGMSARALHDYTAVLPRIRVSDGLGAPEVPGRDTASAIRAGLVWGQVGAIRELVSLSASSFESGSPLRFLLTGGAGETLLPLLDGFELVPSLSLEGLAWTVLDAT